MRYLFRFANLKPDQVNVFIMLYALLAVSSTCGSQERARGALRLRILLLSPEVPVINFNKKEGF